MNRWIVIFFFPYLLFFCFINYSLRKYHIMKDEWFWADVLLMEVDIWYRFPPIFGGEIINE